MPRQEGYLIITDPEGPVIERDTLRCRHCGRHVEVKPATMGQVYLIPDRRVPGGYREVAGAYCGKCHAPICLTCDTGHCEPLERQLERQESRRSILTAAGLL